MFRSVGCRIAKGKIAIRRCDFRIMKLLRDNFSSRDPLVLSLRLSLSLRACAIRELRDRFLKFAAESETPARLSLSQKRARKCQDLPAARYERARFSREWRKNTEQPR